jgi:nucleoid DNA-binding protein
MVYDYTSGQIRQTINARATRLLRAGSNLGLAEQLGAELAEKIIENVFPARIIATESGNAIINAGFGQFDVGDLVEVRRQGQPLRDPYTQESLGVSETPVSQGVIRMVMPKTAVVQITSGERLGDLGTSNYVIRRRLGPDTPTGAGEPSQSLLKKGKKNDDDW